jgi:hypothetical protein
LLLAKVQVEDGLDSDSAEKMLDGVENLQNRYEMSMIVYYGYRLCSPLYFQSAYVIYYVGWLAVASVILSSIIEEFGW